jgi:radical SAM superfamily enzyme YgiQ (UPF0313 family)
LSARLRRCSKNSSVYRRGGERNAHDAVKDIEGVYVPGFYSVDYDSAGASQPAMPPWRRPEAIRKRTIRDISKSFLRTTILTPEAEFSNMFLLEAMRGCPWSCRFCVAGHIYRPVRKKDADSLFAEVREAVQLTQKVGLIGPSLSDYPHAEEVLQMEGVDFSITSLRASAKSGRLVQLMKGHKSIFDRSEAGTQRLRDIINKKINDEDILKPRALS